MSAQLCTQTISNFVNKNMSNTEMPYHAGKMVAVSQSYISYVISGVVIRVIMRGHGAKSKLRPKHGGAVDIKFSPLDDSLLGCVMENGLVVWRLRGPATLFWSLNGF